MAMTLFLYRAKFSSIVFLSLHTTFFMISCEGANTISRIFSTLSCGSWIFAQLPQIIQNYQTKSAEGISPSFLLLWFLGDFLSFTSCLVNGDVVLGFQLYLSIFFLCNDITLCCQYYYYNSVYPRKVGFNRIADTSVLTLASDIDKHVSSEAIHIRNHIDRPLSTSPGSSYGSTGNSPKSRPGTPSLLTTASAAAIMNSATINAMPILTRREVETTSLHSWGFILAWACTCVYVSSRCPQLYKNYKRKSVEGVSPILFAAALMGNLGYTLSILTSCEFLLGNNRTEFFFRELPYIVGSSGTIVFDALYFYQKMLYRDAGRNTTEMGMADWADLQES